MTTAEAKESIKREMMEGFAEWLKDEAEMSDREYGKKYGYGKGTKSHGYDLNSFLVYRDYIATGRYIQGWNKAGYESKVIWQLKDEGFLSYKFYSNWKALQMKQTDWFFISKKTARQIWKETQAA